MASKYAKRHYDDIAEILHAARANVVDTKTGADTRAIYWQTWTLDGLEERFVAVFRADNPRFSADRFRAAAGGR